MCIGFAYLRIGIVTFFWERGNVSSRYFMTRWVTTGFQARSARSLLRTFDCDVFSDSISLALYVERFRDGKSAPVTFFA